MKILPRKPGSSTSTKKPSKNRLKSNDQSAQDIPASPRPRISVSSATASGSSKGRSLVGVIMGSKSDWEVMRSADQTLTDFGVPHECHVMSAHRTPALASEFASGAEARGLEVIIAAAGGAAHLAGVLAAHTVLPILGVPMKSDAL